MAIQQEHGAVLISEMRVYPTLRIASVIMVNGTAIAVLIFAVTGTAVIYVITEAIQQRRRKNKH